MLSDYLASVREGMFLTSILAGFSITIVIELVSSGKRGRLASFVTGAFIFAAAILVATTVSFVMMVALSGSPVGLPHPPSLETLMSVGVALGNLTFLALIAFLAGIGMVGWMHSKPIGILSTITSVLALIFVVWTTLRLAGVGAL